MEYIVVLVTSCFRYLASAPKVHWLEPKLPPSGRRRSSCSVLAVTPTPGLGSLARGLRHALTLTGGRG
jgi:hypothetical protein